MDKNKKKQAENIAGKLATELSCREITKEMLAEMRQDASELLALIDNAVAEAVRS